MGEGDPECQLPQGQSTATCNHAAGHRAEITDRSMSSTDSYPGGVCGWRYCIEPLSVLSTSEQWFLTAAAHHNHLSAFQKMYTRGLYPTFAESGSCGSRVEACLFFQSYLDLLMLCQGWKPQPRSEICQPDGLLVGLGEVGPQVGGLDTEYQNRWWEAREVP